MNLQYIRYALEIARTGSISGAAENLSVAQPNLSRAVKELETGFGIAIFERTRTGMSVTPDGERLLAAGERILREVSEMETMFEGDPTPRKTLSLVFPRADYVTRALASLVEGLSPDGRYDLSFREVGATDALHMVAAGESRLGILRIPAHSETYFTSRLSERELGWSKIATLPSVILTAADLSGADLSGADLSGADLSAAEMYPLTTPDTPTDIGGDKTPARRITADAPTALYALLAADPRAYAVTLPLSSEALADTGLRQYPPEAVGLSPLPAWVDLLIYPKFYRLSEMDTHLSAALGTAAKTCLAGRP